jgi:hypothetical protein
MLGICLVIYSEYFGSFTNLGFNSTSLTFVTAPDLCDRHALPAQRYNFPSPHNQHLAGLRRSILAFYVSSLSVASVPVCISYF